MTKFGGPKFSAPFSKSPLSLQNLKSPANFDASWANGCKGTLSEETDVCISLTLRVSWRNLFSWICMKSNLQTSSHLWGSYHVELWPLAHHSLKHPARMNLELVPRCGVTAWPTENWATLDKCWTSNWAEMESEAMNPSWDLLGIVGCIRDIGSHLRVPYSCWMIHDDSYTFPKKDLQLKRCADEHSQDCTTSKLSDSRIYGNAWKLRYIFG